jgi:hypothetical protein
MNEPVAAPRTSAQKRATGLELFFVRIAARERFGYSARLSSADESSSKSFSFIRFRLFLLQ